jgi:hypothetical protein
MTGMKHWKPSATMASKRTRHWTAGCLAAAAAIGLCHGEEIDPATASPDLSPSRPPPGFSRIGDLCTNSAVPNGFVWPSVIPGDCLFPRSATLAGFFFTERHSDYRLADTYPSWAIDGNLYSPFTDGQVDGVRSGSGKGANAQTGHAVMLGDDPTELIIGITSLPKVASALPYRGRYPCRSLVKDGIWYYGTYCLGPAGTHRQCGFDWNWPNLRPMPGLKKYLMCITDGWPTVAKMTSYILEADVLTSPWKMVAYLKDFGEQAYFLNFPSMFISADGRTLWLCCSANFSQGWNGVELKINPPGGRYGLCLHEIRLLGPHVGKIPPEKPAPQHPTAARPRPTQ